MTCSAYIDQHSKLIAYWAPKCACTAVDHWFAKGALKLNPAYSEIIDDLLNNIDCIEECAPRFFLQRNGFRYSFDDALKYAQSDEYFIVHFTRHPALRLVSAYINKFLIYKGRRLDRFDLLEPFAKYVVADIYRQNRWPTGTYRGIRFNDLVGYLHKRVNIPSVYVDHHWDKQIPNSITRGLNLAPDFIVYAERFNEDLLTLNHHTGINYVPEKYNVTHFSDSTETDENLSFVFSVDLIKSNTKVRAGNLLGQETAEIISQIYSADYEYFEYSPSNIRLPPAATIKS